MKNSIILILFLFIASFSKAQISISSADMPLVNDTIRLSVTNNIQGKDPKLTGANYVWDYSMLTPNSQKIDTFFSVTTFPTNYQFAFNNVALPSHKSNYGLRGQDITFPPVVPIPVSFTDVFNFIKNSSSKYENVGFGSKINGFAYPTRKIPTDVEYQFPLNYSDTSYSNSEFSLNIPTLAYYGQTMERENKVDGWGVLTTPLGTYNVLRVKSILTKVDTLFMDTLGIGFKIPRPQEIEYKWLANAMSIPILKVITTAGIVTSIQYRDVYRIVGIEEKNIISDVVVYPNPTNSLLNIMFSSDRYNQLNYSLKDATGKVVLTNAVNAQVGKNNFTIDLTKHNISKGIYFIELKTDKEIITQKIVFSE